MNYIGYDKNGEKLQLGDICKYTITNSDTKETNEYRGMIVYDDSEFAFMFEQPNDDFPLVFMNLVNVGTIERLTNIFSLTKDFPEYEKWVEIYKSNKEIGLV